MWDKLEFDFNGAKSTAHASLFSSKIYTYLTKLER